MHEQPRVLARPHQPQSGRVSRAMRESIRLPRQAQRRKCVLRQLLGMVTFLKKGQTNPISETGFTCVEKFLV